MTLRVLFMAFIVLPKLAAVRTPLQSPGQQAWPLAYPFRSCRRADCEGEEQTERGRKETKEKKAGAARGNEGNEELFNERVDTRKMPTTGNE